MGRIGVSSFEFRVSSFEFRVSGFGFRVSGFGVFDFKVAGKSLIENAKFRESVERFWHPFRVRMWVHVFRWSADHRLLSGNPAGCIDGLRGLSGGLGTTGYFWQPCGLRE
jgi:hypothetical protein